jgi:hypothetical protein
MEKAVGHLNAAGIGKARRRGRSTFVPPDSRDTVDVAQDYWRLRAPCGTCQCSTRNDQVRCQCMLPNTCEPSRYPRS